MTSTTELPLLRLEVARLRSQHSRRRFDSVLHLGRLDGSYITCAVTSADRTVLDAGTRTEVVETLLERLPEHEGPPAAWLSRPGEPTIQDEDLAWHAAACRAFDVHRRPLAGFWTITRTGWLDVRTGDSRRWKRLRI